MDAYELAGKVFGRKRAESGASSRPRDLTVSGTATSDSQDGLVSIVLDGDMTQAEDDGLEHDGSILMPTEVGVQEGDEVAVTMTGSDVSTVRVTGVVGNGDRQNAAIAAAQTVANAAQAVANAINQHFFADDGGIHVTEATQEDWDENHSGANVLINALGQLFRDGLNNLLTLTTENGARALTIWDGLGNAAENVRAIIGRVITLGKADESHLEMDYHSLQMLDREGRAYFHISDLRNADGWATIEQKFSSNGGSTFNLSFITYPDRIISVTVSGVETTAYSLNMSNHRTITFDSPPTGAIVVTYETNDPATKAYTIGIRADGGLVAPYSVAAGYLVTAGGFYSHAEGFATTANGRCGHAEGFGAFAGGAYSHAGGQSTVASGDGSFVHGVGCTSYREFETVFGRYNELDVFSKHAFVIGNGTDNDHRSNAHTVDWDGNAWYAGDVTDGSGNKLADKLDKTELDVASADLTRGSGASSWTNGVVRRSGKVVTVTINATKLAAALASGAASPVIATVPTGYRPSVLQRVPVCINSTGNYGNAWAVVGTSGNMQIRNTSPTQISTSSEISMSFTYIID